MEKRCYNTQEAQDYLGVKRKFFDHQIAPLLKNGIKAGTSIIYEKTDIDRAWETYKISAGSVRSQGTKWDAQQESTRPKTGVLKSIRSTKSNAFESVASDLLKRQKAGSSVI